MANDDHVFLSYSRNDSAAATNLCSQLERIGLTVFWDQEAVRGGDLWLQRLQDAIDGCGAFVVLLGRDGVNRWIGAETQAALNRHFAPRDEAHRLPIFPVLLRDTNPGTMPSFLRLFQSTLWNAADPLPARLLEHIRDRAIVMDAGTIFEGCPFVGLDAFRVDQAQLFFGRQRETLEALTGFASPAGASSVRWLEINGNSGSGKSSLMNAGVLPLVDQGWLWPYTGFRHWLRIGTMLPGEHPVAMLAEQLARTFNVEMADVRGRLEAGVLGLAEWLRGRKPDSETAFVLAIDQFEELFTFCGAGERRRFDALLGTALEDSDCPLFVISTVRSDFLDRFADLPRLVSVRNRLGKPWTLTAITGEGLREIVTGPARLAGLEVSEVLEAMVIEARNEPGALPLVENALYWLWLQRIGNRLSGRRFSDQGGLAGVLSRGADQHLVSLDSQQRGRALELLFRLVHVDPHGRAHSRRRIPLAEAVAIAGGGAAGRALINRLTGERLRDGSSVAGSLRLLTVSDGVIDGSGLEGPGQWVSLIHETLIRSKGRDVHGELEPYWPRLWDYIERHRSRAALSERLRLQAREWQNRKGLARYFGLAGWLGMMRYRGLATPGSIEQRYLRWSRVGILAQTFAFATIAGVIGESLHWMAERELPPNALAARWAYQLGREPPLPELIEVPEGSVVIGSNSYPAEQPVHRVVFTKPYYLGRTEVTFQQWDACIADGGCDGPRPFDQGWGRGSRPVINVSWRDAQMYVAWLSSRVNRECRLPSEAEWEYSARAGTIGNFALPAVDGSDDIAGQGLANCKGCGSEWDGQQTAPVGQFPANAWGFHDMHGNVFEWVEDCWHSTYQGAPDSGMAWLDAGVDCTARVLRGGSWDFDQLVARSTSRYRFEMSSGLATGIGDHDVGFRVVCSSPIPRADD